MTSTPDFEATNFLDSVGHTTQSIVTCLRNNKLNSKKIQILLSNYSVDALHDGRLIDTARSDGRCVDHATSLLFAHVEFITWLVSHNYTITASSVKWYSWKSILNRNRFHSSPKVAQPQEIIDRIRKMEELVRADIAVYQITAGLIGFQHPIATSPSTSPGPTIPPEEFHLALRKGWDTAVFLY